LKRDLDGGQLLSFFLGNFKTIKILPLGPPPKGEEKNTIQNKRKKKKLPQMR
jgi:hypothetical protein